MLDRSKNVYTPVNSTVSDILQFQRTLLPVLDLETSWASLKGKGFPYSLPGAGPVADPGVQPTANYKSSTRR